VVSRQRGWFIVQSGPLSSRIRRNEITQHCTPVRLLPLARPLGRSAADRLCVWSRWWWVAGQRVPADDRLLDGWSPGPSWDLDKQPFVFVDAFVSQCGDLPTTSTWTQPHDRPMLFLTYLFSAQASRLMPLLCAFYFTGRSKSK